MRRPAAHREESAPAPQDRLGGSGPEEGRNWRREAGFAKDRGMLGLSRSVFTSCRRSAVGLLVAGLLTACTPSRPDEDAQGHALGPRADLVDHPSSQPSSIPPQTAKWRGLFNTPDHLPNTPPHFCKAKGRALEINLPHGETFYCGCDFTANMEFSRQRCGYQPHHQSHRSERVEWEHIVPVVTMMAHRRCASEKLCTDAEGKEYSGIKCCEEIDTKFRKMETDLQNLFPVVGELNGARANHDFGEVPGEQRAYGRCDFETDHERKVVEPPANVRGDIARVYLYMHNVYGDALPLTPAQQRLFAAWHAADPPDDWERSRNRAIARMQGAGNPLIEEDAGVGERTVDPSTQGPGKPPPEVPQSRSSAAQRARSQDPTPPGRGQSP